MCSSDLAPATSQTQWTSATGEVWTVNQDSNATGYKGVLVFRSMLQGDGIAAKMATSTNQFTTFPATIYTAFRGFVNNTGSGKSVFGNGNIDGAVTRYNSTQYGAWIGNGGDGVLLQTASVSNLGLATMVRKNTGNTLQANNGTAASDSRTSSYTNSTIALFGNRFGYDCSIATSLMLSKQEDSSGNKTSIYQYLRSINSNAF